MRIEAESGIEFDFSAATDLRKHDKPLIHGGEGNSVWKGIDFRVELPGEWLWIEVKSWDLSSIAPARRGGQQRRFVSKMKSEVFGLELRSKFFGTTAFLAWTGSFQPTKVVYVLILQPPRPLDKALLVTFWDMRLKPAIPSPNPPWTHSLSCAVVDVNDWNLLYPTLPARIL